MKEEGNPEERLAEDEMLERRDISTIRSSDQSKGHGGDMNRVVQQRQQHVDGTGSILTAGTDERMETRRQWIEQHAAQNDAGAKQFATYADYYEHFWQESALNPAQPLLEADFTGVRHMMAHVKRKSKKSDTVVLVCFDFSTVPTVFALKLHVVVIYMYSRCRSCCYTSHCRPRRSF